MRRRNESARCPLLCRRGERRSAVAATVATSAIAAAVPAAFASTTVSATTITATLASTTVAASALTASGATAAIATAAIATTVTSTTIATSTVSTAVASTVATTDPVPGQLDPHVHAARLDIHARVWRLRAFGDVDGWLRRPSNMARRVRQMPAVRRSSVPAE